MRSDHPHVDLRAEHEKFTDYWRDQPGAKGRKVDWTGTWRNWIRRAAEQARPHVNGTNGKPVHKMRALVDLAAEVRAQEQAQLTESARKAIE